MALSTGTRLGSYEIVAALGAGGMGEVYRARDAKLNRDVAIKVLPDSVANDHERLARFRREAQVLASLNHQNIAHIYGLEEGQARLAGAASALGGATAPKQAGSDSAFIVMELVEGEDLSQRIARGPIPLDEALAIARQVAEALEVAHERGIIHRDLKPANIKVRPDGTVKVLDFGLAKAIEGTGEASGVGQAGRNISLSPTITSPAMTQAGIILGTAAYMSPEQARGKPVDKRSDIWAFGCVLYEMVTGRRAFGGEEVTDTLAFIITKDVDWTALPADCPLSIRALIRRCLEKDRTRRRGDIHDVKLDIDEALTTTVSDIANSVQGRPAEAGRHESGTWRRAMPWAVATALAVALVAALAEWAPWTPAASPAAPMRLNAELGADASLINNAGDTAILSPDGTVLAFVAQKSGGRGQIYVRRLEQFVASPLAGTDNARGIFFSPNGQWLGFFADGKLKKIAVTGGAAVTLCDAPDDRGGAWAEDGTIVFVPLASPGTSIQRVSESGGTPEQVAAIGAGDSARFPRVLPGGTALLYTASNNPSTNDDANVVVQPLPSGTAKVVQRGGYDARYIPSGLGSPVRAERDSGHLVYMHNGTLFAAAFDLTQLELAGSPVPVLEGVTANTAAGSALFSVSDTGVLVYLPGQNIGAEAAINWMDRQGKVLPLRGAPANWSNPHFSPDGRRLAVDISDGRHTDVWTYDWARDTLSRLTFDNGDDLKPVWTPDGNRIVFRSARDKSPGNLYWQRADGTGEVQRLTESQNIQLPGSWHPSGKFLAFAENIVGGNPDILILPMTGDNTSGWKPGKPTDFLRTPFAEFEPMFSPDGRWIAYQSNETGRNEIYVRPFPGPGGKWQVSTGGGAVPTWSRVHPELFYVTPGLQIMYAHWTAEGDSFRADQAVLWSDARISGRPRNRHLDLHSDGDRFAVAASQDTQGISKVDHLRIVSNFFDELRRVAPVTKR